MSLPESFQIVEYPNTLSSDTPPIPNIPNTEDPTIVNDSDFMYLVIKTSLVLWDLVGFVLNGLGIDLLWHRVEVNHAVYNVLLQDVVLACLTSGVSLGVSIYIWPDNLTWFRVHSLLTLLPLVFHNWAWAVVAHLR